jgi:hypothetical protein
MFFYWHKRARMSVYRTSNMLLLEGCTDNKLLLIKFGWWMLNKPPASHPTVSNLISEQSLLDLWWTGLGIGQAILRLVLFSPCHYSPTYDSYSLILLTHTHTHTLYIYNISS